MKEALSSSETSLLTRATQRNSPEDTILHSHRRENLKSYMFSTVYELEDMTTQLSIPDGAFITHRYFVSMSWSTPVPICCSFMCFESPRLLLHQQCVGEQCIQVLCGFHLPDGRVPRPTRRTWTADARYGTSEGGWMFLSNDEPVTSPGNSLCLGSWGRRRLHPTFLPFSPSTLSLVCTI
jgi:hypothetical protein